MYTHGCHISASMYWWVVPLASKLQGWPRTVEEEVAEEFRRVVNEMANPVWPVHKQNELTELFGRRPEKMMFEFSSRSDDDP